MCWQIPSCKPKSPPACSSCDSVCGTLQSKPYHAIDQSRGFFRQCSYVQRNCQALLWNTYTRFNQLVTHPALHSRIRYRNDNPFWCDRHKFQPVCPSGTGMQHVLPEKHQSRMYSSFGWLLGHAVYSCRLWSCLNLKEGKQLNLGTDIHIVAHLQESISFPRWIQSKSSSWWISLVLRIRWACCHRPIWREDL